MKKYFRIKNRIAVYARLCIIVSLCFLIGCGKSAEEGEMAANANEGGQSAGTTQEQAVSQNEEKEGTGGQENLTEKEKEREREEDSIQNDVTDPAGEGTEQAGAQQENSAAAPEFPLLENYRERGIVLHPDIDGLGEGYCNVIQNKEGKIEWFTIDARTSKGDSLLWKYTLNEDGASWTKEAVAWTQGIKGRLQEGRITILLGEDNHYYAYYCDEEQLYHFVKQTEDSFEEIVIPDWDITKERQYRMIPGVVCVAENGNIIMADRGNECFIYSPQDGQILDYFRCGWYGSMCVSGNEVFMQDRESGSILHYDVQKLTQLPPIEGNFGNEVRLAVCGDDLYACCKQGIFRAKKDGGSFQKIMDAGKYYFSKENGNPLELFMEEDAFYMIYGEQRGVIKKYAPRDPDEEYLGTFTVYSMDNNDLILDLVAEFQALHPELDVFYETGEGAEGSTTAADRIRALNARILAGDGPDVLVLDGLPVQSYLKKGILSDLSTVLAEEMDNITPNILANYMQADALYMLPLRFMVPMFGTCGQDAAIFDSLELFAEYCEKEEKQVLPASLPYQYVLELLYYNFPPEFVTENGNVNREKIGEFLGLAERVCNAVKAVPLAESLFLPEGNDYLHGMTIEGWYQLKEQEVIFINMAGNLWYYPDEVRQRGGELLGNHGLYFTNGMLGINAQSEQKELAEMFVKEAFSYKLQSLDSYGSGFSVHNMRLEEMAQQDDSRSTLSRGRKETGEILRLRGSTQADWQQMMELARTVSIPVEHNQVIYDIVVDETDAFLNGKKSLEAAAEEIADRISLYYYE